MKPKIVVTKPLYLYPDQKTRLESFGEVTYYDTDPTSPEEWIERCQGANIICSGVTGMKSEKLYSLKDVFISLPFVGIDFLDIQKLRQSNISVSNSPGCNKESVAEWAIGMILMHFRRLRDLTRTQGTKDEILQTATGLYMKYITILGNGNIAKQLGGICESLGMMVTYFKRGDDLHEQVKDADIVVNCLSLNGETERMLDREFFQSMKRGTFFVSASRSQIYDMQALKEALDNGTLIGAADDAVEPGDIDDVYYRELLAHPKILVTPHIAWNTDSEHRKANDMMIDNIEAWINKKPIHLVV